MELGPIPGIDRVRPVNVPEKGRNLPSPLAPDRSGRIGDDDYRERGDEPGEDLVGDDAEAPEQDQTDTAPDKTIDMIA